MDVDTPQDSSVQQEERPVQSTETGREDVDMDKNNDNAQADNESGSGVPASSNSAKDAGFKNMSSFFQPRKKTVENGTKSNGKEKEVSEDTVDGIEKRGALPWYVWESAHGLRLIRG